MNGEVVGGGCSPGENHRCMPGGMGGVERAVVNGMRSMRGREIGLRSSVLELGDIDERYV